VEKLKQEVSKPEDQRLISARQISKLLVESDLSVYLEGFLPKSDVAYQQKDLEALNLSGPLLPGQASAGAQIEVSRRSLEGNSPDHEHS
jgi:hypothetical protein